MTRHPDYPKERLVLKLFREAFLGRDPRTFPVQLSDIIRLERYFQLDINIFELNWVDGKSRAKIIYEVKVCLSV